MASAPEPLSAPTTPPTTSSNDDNTGPSFTDVLSQQTTSAANASNASNASNGSNASSTSTEVSADAAPSNQHPVTSPEARRDPSTSKSTSKEKSATATPLHVGAPLTPTTLPGAVVQQSVVAPVTAGTKDPSLHASSTSASNKDSVDVQSLKAAPSTPALVTSSDVQSVEQASADALDSAEGSVTPSYAQAATTSASSDADGRVALDTPAAAVTSPDASLANAGSDVANQVNAAVDASLTSSTPASAGGTSDAKNAASLPTTAPLAFKVGAQDERSRSLLNVAGSNASAREDDLSGTSHDTASRPGVDGGEQVSRTDGPQARSSGGDFASALSSSRASGPGVGAGASASGLTSASASFASSLSGSSLDIDGLSGSISRPLVDGNGTYSVSVALHPADLGRVQVEMSLDGNDLQVAITSQSQVGHAALTNSVESLKEQLSRGGMNVNVTLHDAGAQSGGNGRDRNTAPRTQSSDLDVSDEPSAPLPLASPGQIHLVL